MPISYSYTPKTSIEAEKAEAKARKINVFSPQLSSELSCLVFPFKLSRNSEIYIKKEIVPKKALILKTSLLNKNQGIKGKIISGYSKKQFPDKSVKKGSGTHKASFMTFNKFVFAKLEKSFQSLENMPPKLIVRE